MVVISYPLCCNDSSTITVLYTILIGVVVLLYGIDISVMMFILLIIFGHSIGGFIVLELFFVAVLLTLLISSSTYERSGASLYLGYFSLAIGFMLVALFDLNILSVIVLLVILAKLPLVGLHI